MGLITQARRHRNASSRGRRGRMAALESSASFPITLSLPVAITALALGTPIGIAVAWLQARRRYALRTLVDALVLLPLVLPPSVVGFFLVVVFGRRGFLGAWLDSAFGFRLVFTPAGAVVASALVALPILVKTAQPALEAVPSELENVGRSLCPAPLPPFFPVTLPSALRGVLPPLLAAPPRPLR